MYFRTKDDKLHIQCGGKKKQYTVRGIGADQHTNLHQEVVDKACFAWLPKNQITRALDVLVLCFASEK